MATRSLSGGNEVWLAPATIRFKVSPHHDLVGIKGGDWDRERLHPIEGLVKHRAIRQRFTEGARWEDTELFRVTYRRRLTTGDTVRGVATMEALLAQYYDRVDGLYHRMKREGFVATGHPLPVILIGRDGIFIGNQGNHRLAIAQVLGLDRFAGKVICRHPLA